MMASANSTMSPDTVSPRYPDRPIRPLPKRRLRDRLSPEVAESIRYPPSSHGSSPLFYYPPYSPKDGRSSPRASSSLLDAGRGEDFGGYNGQGVRVNGGREDGQDARGAVRSSSAAVLRPGTRSPSRNDGPKHVTHQSPASTVSSIDSFETNNKKKRKIPTAGDAALHSAHSLNDMLGMSLPTTISLPATPSQGEAAYSSPSYPSSANFPSGNQAVSGPGRGRYGRTRSARSPLRDLPGGSNNWGARGVKTRGSQWSSQMGDAEGSGIIANAIANAEKLQGQENLNLPRQNSNGGSSSKDIPFTFTCDSQVPGSINWPGSDQAGHTAGEVGIRYAKPGKESRGSGDNMATGQDGIPAQAAAAGNGASTEKRNRRRLEREYAMAAKQRRLQVQWTNYNNPPKNEDLWVCEFCEYERIFGAPPRVLIRDYEIKDRRIRRQQEERRRLLDKAKAKRKGKKPPKAGGRTASGQTQDQQQHPADEQYANPDGHEWAPGEGDHGHSMHSGGCESDVAEFDSDEGPPGSWRDDPYQHGGDPDT